MTKTESLSTNFHRPGGGNQQDYTDFRLLCEVESRSHFEEEVKGNKSAYQGNKKTYFPINEDYYYVLRRKNQWVAVANPSTASLRRAAKLTTNTQETWHQK